MKTITVLAALAATLIAAQAQDWAKAKLEKSPRHHEWADVKNGARTVRTFVAYPEVKDKAPVVIVIHENKGLTDWVRLAADEFAEAGCIAVAPDLLSGMAPGGGGTSEFKDTDAATQGIYKLPQDQVTADLQAVAKYGSSIPAGNGKLIVAGFCWGGGQSFRFATDEKDLKAALVFYGTGPDASAIKRINCPVYGFYGGSDNRVNATIPKSKEAMKAAGKTYDPVIYDGAGHGFMRAGEEPDAKSANKKGRDDAWLRIKEILKKL